MGSWRPDEYHDFGLFRSDGLAFWLQRLRTWSPRPISEALIGLYYLAGQATRSQLIGPFLGLVNLLLFVGPALWAWYARSKEGVLDRALIGAVTVCLFLLGHPVAEFFYWPLGAVAYVPTLAAVTALTFHLLDGHPEQKAGRVFCVACVLCAAGSAEVGAIFAIFFSALMMVLYVTGCFLPVRAARSWLSPFLFGVALMVLLSIGRGSLDEHITFRGMSPNPKLQYHVWASVFRTVPTYFRQIAVLDGAQSGAGAIVWGLAVKLLFFLGLIAFFRGSAVFAPSRQQRLGLLALLFGLQATFLTSIVASYYKFGLVCCERHDTWRQCLLVLTALAGAAFISSQIPAPIRRGRDRAVGAGLLGLALIVLVVPELPSLGAAYAVRQETIAIRQANWQSGQSSGPRMTMLMAPLPPIVDGMMPPVGGTFREGGDTPQVFNLIMKFFGKQEIRLEVVQP